MKVAISTHSLRNLSNKTMVCKPVSKTLSNKTMVYKPVS